MVERTAEWKIEAVELSRRVGAASAARALESPVGTLARWRHEAARAEATGKPWPLRASTARRPRRRGGKACRSRTGALQMVEVLQAANSHCFSTESTFKRCTVRCAGPRKKRRPESREKIAQPLKS